MDSDSSETGLFDLFGHKVLDPVQPAVKASERSRLVESFSVFYKNEFIPVVKFVMKTQVRATVHEARDAAQAAFVEAWKAWDKINSPHAWIRTVATRVYLRSIPSHEVISDTSISRPTPDVSEAQLPISERTRRLRDLLATLPMSQRLAMAWLVDGFSVKEIAKELGTTPGAVHQNIRRARSTLKQRLETSGEGGENEHPLLG